jgi:hypothetical protein
MDSFSVEIPFRTRNYIYYMIPNGITLMSSPTLKQLLQKSVYVMSVTPYMLKHVQ